ncbi:MAG: hypothetical protein WCV93_01470 [Candidatus Shapirobacteria bacterium]
MEVLLLFPTTTGVFAGLAVGWILRKVGFFVNFVGYIVLTGLVFGLVLVVGLDSDLAIGFMIGLAPNLVLYYGRRK